LIRLPLLAGHLSICAFWDGVLRPFCAQLFLALLLFAGAVSAQPQTFRVPFETRSGLIFLRTTLDKQQALLLLDTGSNVSFAFKDGAASELRGDHFRTTEEFPSRVVFRYPDILKDSQGIVGQDIRQNAALCESFST
jgi:hypothetical protein